MSKMPEKLSAREVFVEDLVVPASILGYDLFLGRAPIRAESLDGEKIVALGRAMGSDGSIGLLALGGNLPRIAEGQYHLSLAHPEVRAAACMALHVRAICIEGWYLDNMKNENPNLIAAVLWNLLLRVELGLPTRPVLGDWFRCYSQPWSGKDRRKRFNALYRTSASTALVRSGWGLRNVSLDLKLQGPGSPHEKLAGGPEQGKEGADALDRVALVHGFMLQENHFISWKLPDNELVYLNTLRKPQ